jgi:hypothetical protein
LFAPEARIVEAGVRSWIHGRSSALLTQLVSSLSPVAGAEDPEDTLNVGAHRVPRDPERRGYLAVGPAPGEKRRDL